MDERKAIRTPEEWARFAKRLFVRCLIVAVACGSVAALLCYRSPDGSLFGYEFHGFGFVIHNIALAGLLLLLFVILAFAAGVSAFAALLGLYAWIGILLNIWIRKRWRE